MRDGTADRVAVDDTHVAAAGHPHDLEIAEAAEAFGKVQPRHGAQRKVRGISPNSVLPGEGRSLRCCYRGASSW
jgi:hypothetical protein